MVSPRSLSQVYVRLVALGLLCSSCIAPGKLQRSATESITGTASERQSVAQSVTVSPISRDRRTAEMQRDRYGELPLSFEANRGQTSSQVRFLSRGPGYALFLTATEAVLALQGRREKGENNPDFGLPTFLPPPPGPTTQSPTVVRMQLLGANPTPQVTGTEQLAGKVNYLHGNDPARWHTGIPTYRTVHYQEVYPGIDLVYYGKQRQLEYDFIVAPGIDPSTIRLTFTDQAGHPLPQRLDAQGNLILHMAAGEVRLQKPFMYQDHNGLRAEVAGSYAPQEASVGFQVASYDKSKPLVIDPLLIVYSTFLGGDRRDSAFAMALDEDRNVYLAGQTLSANFPLTTGTVDPSADVDNGDAFVAKLNDAGTEILYSTYLGGPGADVAKAIAVDSEGNAYIAGETLASGHLTPGFPTTPGVVQPTAGGGVADAFVAKLDATGSTLLYSTYLGGRAYDRANGIAIDGDGNAYIVGQTLSDFFLPGSAPQTIFGSGPIAPNSSAALPHDAFVVKLNPTGTARSYTAVFSARAFEDATAVAVNANGEAYVVGNTTSSNFPLTPNAFRGKGGIDGTSDAFVVKLNAAGTSLRYSTYLGGVGETILDPSGEAAFAVAIDSAGYAVVTGITRAPDFPTTEGALETSLRDVQDGFLAIIDPTAVFSGEEEERLPVYSTYLGGSHLLQVSGMTVIGSGRFRLVYLAGTTKPGFPTSLCATQQIYGGGPSDAFIDKIGIDLVERENTGVAYATYLGGSEKDEAYGFAVDSDRNMYVAGLTQSSSLFTTLDSVQPSFGGSEDAFVTKFDTLSHGPCADLRLTMTDAPDPITVGNTVTYSLAVTNLGPDFAANVTVTDILPSGMTLLSATPSTGACVGTSTITCSMGTFTLTQTATITIVAQATAAGTPINRASVTGSGPDLDENNNTTAVNTSVVSGHRLTVAVRNETGAEGQITSRPEGIACPPDCAESFPPGTSVNLTARPEMTTSAFDRWGGACSGSGASSFCNVTVDGDLAVEASFAAATGLAGDWVGLTQTCRVKGKRQQPRCRITGTLKVMNTGPVRAEKFITRFFFSDDPTLNAGFVVLKDKKVPALEAGGERLLQVNFRLPSGTDGRGKYVVAYIDADAQVPEGNEANNRAVFGPLP